MKKFDFSKEFGNIDPKYIEEAVSVYCSSFQDSVRLAWTHCKMHKFHSAHMFISLIC